jgi:hypothetical protein
MLDVVELKQLIEKGDARAVAEIIKRHNLTIGNGNISGTKKQASEAYEYWDKRQLVKKINLNSAYGALLANGCRFLDQRIGQSTTLTGRSIARHMASQVNSMFTGEYDHTGMTVVYGDTDSQICTTKIVTSEGELTIEDLFLSGEIYWNHGDKEYSSNPNIKVLSYDSEAGEAYMGYTNYIYRHKVSKDLYEIEDALGNTVVVTQDHSVMIERNGVLMEAKPADIMENDVLISIKTIE